MFFNNLDGFESKFPKTEEAILEGASTEVNILLVPRYLLTDFLIILIGDFLLEYFSYSYTCRFI
jgi:hypothetical protein